MRNAEMPKCQIKYVWSPHDVILELLVTKLNLNKVYTEFRDKSSSRQVNNIQEIKSHIYNAKIIMV